MASINTYAASIDFIPLGERWLRRRTTRESEGCRSHRRTMNVSGGLDREKMVAREGYIQSPTLTEPLFSKTYRAAGSRSRAGCLSTDGYSHRPNSRPASRPDGERHRCGYRVVGDNLVVVVGERERMAKLDRMTPERLAHILARELLVSHRPVRWPRALRPHHHAVHGSLVDEGAVMPVRRSAPARSSSSSVRAERRHDNAHREGHGTRRRAILADSRSRR